MVKNEKLQENMLTPTTKEEHHDRPITPAEIVNENWMTKEDWGYCSNKDLELFSFGQKKGPGPTKKWKRWFLELFSGGPSSYFDQFPGSKPPKS